MREMADGGGERIVREAKLVSDVARQRYRSWWWRELGLRGYQWTKGAGQRRIYILQYMDGKE
jgi:hypothetical protein